MGISDWADFQGVNAGYAAELYERYRHDPNTVDADTRAFFDKYSPPEFAPPAPPSTPNASPANVDKIVAAVNLAESIRKFGNLAAHLDPLGSELPGDPSLIPENYGLGEEDLKRLPASIIKGPVTEGASSAWEVIQSLVRIYCSHSGYDYAHLRDPEERRWLREATEGGWFRPPKAPVNEVAVLERLTQEGAFELFLHRTFPGKTRFSIEGLGMLIPVIDEIVGAAAEAGAQQILIGMGHRGRLNVLTHVLNKSYRQILAEFKDPVKASKFRGDLGWTGDVKYHSGASRAVANGEEHRLIISMAPNPSHLEAVDPVVLGMARAAGTRVDRPGPALFDPSRSLPLLIHGDAAFPGQGVVAETLNLFRLPGFHTGGTIHIIANNQLGFTTTPEEGRSTIFASDLARGFRIPIVHVNSDDPEACLEAARLAFAYRTRFHKDFLIDLVGYRRYGHNEGDEPGFTQPLMYQKIAGHPTVRQLWVKTLLDRGVIREGFAEELVHKHANSIQEAFNSLEPERQIVEPISEPAPAGVAGRTHTAVPLERLRALNDALRHLPEGLTVNRKLERAIERKRSIMNTPGEKTVDWASAEELAWASILEDGIPIRVTGQDVERGTFSQRHAAFHDTATGLKYIPLQSLPQAKAAFEIRNSPLSENAVLGFEYGYNVNAPARLVIWEAQYGDFVNGAQTVIDEFIVSARAKWGLTPSLVMLLPHGLEGQGPDHSSGRPERFLSLAAAINLRLANCTTAAQYFHLMRRQAMLLEKDPLPLIVLTPKSLLRHPLVASSPLELAEGRWQPVIDDKEAKTRAAKIRRLILCSGKVYVDLVSAPERNQSQAVAVCRLEQLYPLPEDDLKDLIASYPAVDEVVWLQEEPRNMGAWEFVRLQLARLIDGRCPLHYVGRPRSSSPAEGSSAWHALNQQMIIRQAFEMKDVGAEETLLLKKA
ncbi:MAG TPA: 2-oxoglutarate dehydrogenase E1 component [Terriglobia bacterium]|nr:2-oxoglutarate dehydrogenase E1 component [Terriglobia bacterium]